MKNAGVLHFLCVLSFLLFLPHPSHAQTYQHLDLSWAANMGFSDEVEGDGKGGWTDQGADIDMRDLPTGRREFAGIPFKVIDPDKNKGRSALVLAGRQRPGFPKEAVIDAEGRRAAVLYFLQTCAWGGTAKNKSVAEYVIRYQDGREAVIPLRVGVEFTNWWDIRKGDACVVAWSHEKRGVRRGVNIFTWKNPRPDAPLKSLTFRSLGRMPVPILLAVTLSDAETRVEAVPEPATTVSTADWPVFEAGRADPSGTAVDVGAVLRGLKLKEERWWGVSLPRETLLKGQEVLTPILSRMSAYGCNLLRIPLAGSALSDKEMEGLKALAPLCQSLGVWLLLDPGVRDPAATPAVASGPMKTVLDAGLSPDVFLDPSLFVIGTADDRATQDDGDLTVDLQPVLMDPRTSFTCRLAAARRFGSPYLGVYSGAFPNAYGAERPLLAAAMGSFQGWEACATIDTIGAEWGAQIPSDLGTQPAWMTQFPAAALAFRRGDLKEARVEWVCPESGDCGMQALVHRAGWRPAGPKATDNLASNGSLIQEKTRKIVTESGQLSWQGNIGVAQVNAPRFQAVMGFLANRRLKNAVWDVESPNEYAVLSAVSLTKEGIQRSKHVLLSASARVVNSGMSFSADRKRCLSLGKAPVHKEPVRATVVLHRLRPEPGLKVRALDVSGHPLKKGPKIRWLNNDVYMTWVPEATYLEVTAP